MNNNKVVLVVLDGVGYSQNKEYNAVETANFNIKQGDLNSLINASGEWVGLTDGDMGNSEVGHNTMGAGRIYKQGSALLNDSFASHNHAVIVLLNNLYVIEDMGSVNKTYVNNQPITGRQYLQTGDLITIGSVTFQFGR